MVGDGLLRPAPPTGSRARRRLPHVHLERLEAPERNAVAHRSDRPDGRSRVAAGPAAVPTDDGGVARYPSESPELLVGLAERGESGLRLAASPVPIGE